MHNAARSKSRDGQGLSPWVAPLAVVASVLLGWGAIAKSLHESLWLDELHSVWCATGTSEEVFHRAALGNQLSPFFWLLRWTSQTFGTSEAVWRAPSVCAWLGLVGLCGWMLGRLAGQSGRPLVLLALALIVLDRLQIFYATEARPYALVALVNLGAWLAMAAWSCHWFSAVPRPSSSRWQLSLWFAWCALNSLACWFQPTAVLSVAAQYLFLLGRWLVSTWRSTPRADRPFGTLAPVWLAAGIFVLSMLATLHVLGPVWQHRQRWAAFAAGTGADDVLQLLPFAALAGPLAIGVALHWLLALGQGSSTRLRGTPLRGTGSHGRRWLSAGFDWFACEPSQDRASHGSARGREWWMWLLAWLVPCALVYLLTASGIAPLMHRRYVFVAAAPFVLWTASSVSCLRGRGLRLAVLFTMIATLLFQQGSVQVWLQGGWPGAVRGEDWRGAVQWINSQTSPEKPVVVFCASNLIEGAGEIPAEQTMREYLTLPLRSLYQVQAASRLVPLANAPTSWARTVAAEMTWPGDQAAWLVVRSSAGGLERRLQASGLSAGERRSFGGVQVVRDVGFKKMP